MILKKRLGKGRKSTGILRSDLPGTERSGAVGGVAQGVPTDHDALREAGGEPARQGQASVHPTLLPGLEAFSGRT